MSTSHADATSPKGLPGGLLGLICNPGLSLLTLFRGKYAGRDAVGNQYYERPWRKGSARTRRWVIYAGEPDASTVAPEWHAWLHHLTEAPLSAAENKPWQRPHQPNLTGTAASYHPAAPAATGYEAWTPDQG
jgi:NADH:ubiquinone oxidoreductase subunit